MLNAWPVTAAALSQSQIDGPGGDLVRLQPPAQRRDAGFEFWQRDPPALCVVLDAAVVHYGVHRAGADGVDGHDAGGGDFQRHRPHQAQHAVLAGGVGRAVQAADLAIDRGHHDDPPPLPRQHVGQHSFRQQVRRRQVHRHGQVPKIVAKVDERPWIGAAADAGVVHQDVDRPNARLPSATTSAASGRCDRSATIGRAVPPAERIAPTTSSSFTRRAGRDSDFGPFLAVCQGDRPADPTAGARHQATRFFAVVP